MTNTKTLLSVAAVSVLALNGCGGGGSTSSSGGTANIRPADCAESDYTTPDKEVLPNEIKKCTYLTKDKTWIIDGLVVVKGTTLKIEKGTKLAGEEGKSTNASYMIIDKDAKILAQGTKEHPIVFNSKIAANGGAAAEGQWGGLTIIGNAGNDQSEAYEVNQKFKPGKGNFEDNSGVLSYVEIHNTGVTVAQNKEINGLSLVGVGSGTKIEHITVKKSGDDCVEAWGGTVNMSDINLSECGDDQFDIDDGYSGTVRGLKINQTKGNAAIEMSGITDARFEDFTIIQTESEEEGGIYFKGPNIGGHFKNGTVIDNSPDGHGAIHSKGDADINHTSFSNVTLKGSSRDHRFTGDSAVALEAEFDAGTGNTKQ